MARKKVTPEEEIVNTAVEGIALGSVPAGSVLHDEAGADTGDVPAELPEGDLSAEETAEQSETLPAMEAAEAKPFGLSAEEKTASQEENDTVEKRAEEAELHEETSEFLEAAEDLHSNLPASAPHGSEADGADWGFEEPVTEEAAAEPAEDEYLAAAERRGTERMELHLCLFPRPQRHYRNDHRCGSLRKIPSAQRGKNA